MNMDDQTIIIRAFPSHEGGVYYEIYTSESKGLDVADKALDSVDDSDGGICTSASWQNALAMAAGQAADAMVDKFGEPDPCWDDNPNVCGCNRCISGDVRHCPECYGEERANCPLCKGEGAISLKS